MELSLGLFFGNQGQIGQPLSEEISLLKCSSRSKQKILGVLLKCDDRFSSNRCTKILPCVWLIYFWDFGTKIARKLLVTF